MSDTNDIEDVESFTLRARTWLKENMPPIPPGYVGFQGGGSLHSDEEELARTARCRELQRMLFDGGLAGICVPKEYGGQGLTFDHQLALNREIAGYDYPAETQVPTFTPCMAVILEFGTHEQKLRQIPPILKGETFWMQFLSEPSGG
jgi:alkylation response protein AidB-like acyl-CoA dehydrogenase